MDRNSSHGTPPKEKERRDSKAERPSSPPSRVDALKAEEDDGEENKSLIGLLEATAIATLLPKQEVIQVSKNETVAAALELMAKNNIVSVPVRDDSAGRFVGMFDTLDLVALSLSVATDKDPVAHFFNTPVGKVINFSTVDVFAPMSGELSLYHLVETFTRGIHRIPVFDSKGQKVVSVASQSLVVKFLAEHLGQLGRAGSKSLKDLHLGVKKVVTVEESAKAIEGYKLMDANKLESIAVVSADGKLVGQLSASDLRGLAKDLFSSLDKRISDFIGKAKKISTCSPDAKLKDVIKQLAAGSLHRLWIVDKEHHPIGVVSLGDVMKALMLSLNVTPKRKKTRSVDFSKLKGFKGLNLPPEDARPNSPPKPASP